MKSFSMKLLLILLVASASAWAVDVYKWDDENGIVRYSDRWPPPGAKNVQKYHSTNSGLVLEKPVTTTQETGDDAPKPKPESALTPADKLPVVVYSFDECGDPCKQAEAFLKKRGVPYTRKDSNSDKIELKKLTGKMEAPVMVIGNTAPVSGFREERWNQELDLAGYPKSSPITKPSAAQPSTSAAPGESGQE